MGGSRNAKAIPDTYDRIVVVWQDSHGVNLSCSAGGGAGGRGGRVARFLRGRTSVGLDEKASVNHFA